MEKMDEITRRLAIQQPVLKDAEALTESIMANLPPQKRPLGQQYLRAVQWISSVAAICLLVLFYSQRRSIVERPNDIDYGQSLQRFQPEYLQILDNLPPREAFCQFNEMKRSRASISHIKRHFTSLQ